VEAFQKSTSETTLDLRDAWDPQADLILPTFATGGPPLAAIHQDLVQGCRVKKLSQAGYADYTTSQELSNLRPDHGGRRWERIARKPL